MPCCCVLMCTSHWMLCSNASAQADSVPPFHGEGLQKFLCSLYLLCHSSQFTKFLAVFEINASFHCGFYAPQIQRHSIWTAVWIHMVEYVVHAVWQCYIHLLQDERRTLYSAINMVPYLLLPFYSPSTRKESTCGYKSVSQNWNFPKILNSSGMQSTWAAERSRPLHGLGFCKLLNKSSTEDIGKLFCLGFPLCQTLFSEM